MKRIILLAGLLVVLLTITSNIFAQTSAIIKGNVTDKVTAEPLPFVNVGEIDKNGRIVSGAVTDINGNYMLKVRDNKNSIQISFIGYKKATFSINNRTQIDIQLESESQTVEEVVVQGQKVGNDGVTQIRDRATAVARMELKEMSAISSTSVEEMMQGRLGNVDITSVSGDPGAGVNIRIRGTSTLNARNTPLIVVNGIPYESKAEGFDFQSADIEKFGSLIDVSPEDIESIEVLKDAASTAVWGSKAANGVLMIKTKRGIKSKPIFEYTFKTNIGKEPKAIKMLDGPGYARLMREEHYNYKRGTMSASDNQQIAYDPYWEDYYNYSQNTDWVKEITQLAFTSQHDFSVRGGGDKSRYNMSVGYADEGGTTIGNRQKKLNLRSSLDYTLSTKLQFKTDIMYTHYDQLSNYNGDVRSVAYKKMPNLSVYKRDTANVVYYDEFFTPTQTLQGDAQSYYNPVAMVTLGKSNSIRDNARALFSIKYNILPELIFNSTVTLDIFDSKDSKFLPYKAIGYNYNSGVTNRASNGFTKKSSIFTINQLIYHPNFGKNHDFTAMAQFDTEETVNRSFNTESSLSASPYLQEPVGDVHLNSFGANYSKYRSMGLFTTVSYKYLDRYIFMVGAKYEGNSKFSKESRWGMFPTVSLAWRINDEPFLRDFKFINDLKLRGSWGQSGNSPGANYLYFNTYKAGSDISYLDFQGVVPNGIELSSLKWETIDQINLGFSLFALKDRLNIEFDVYDKKTLDLLLTNSGIPSTTGFSGLTQNYGTLKNSGIEFAIDYTFLKTEDWNASFNFNISKNQNVVVELPDNYRFDIGDMLTNGTYKIKIQPGAPIGSFYGYRYLGVYPTDEDAIVRDDKGNPIYSVTGDEPMRMIHGGSEGYQFMGGDAKYADRNYDGKIDELDIDNLGSLNPDFMGGAGGRLKYKNFVLNTFFHFKVGQKIINQTRMETEKMYNHDNQAFSTNWRWRTQGDGANPDYAEYNHLIMPRALYNYGYNWLGSDRFVEDGSFLRLKTLSLSYFFDKKFCKKLNVNELKLYSTAYNLFTWTNYSGQDPDVSPPSRPDSLPKDNSRTPPGKRIMLGINISF